MIKREAGKGKQETGKGRRETGDGKKGKKVFDYPLFCLDLYSMHSCNSS